MSTSVQRAMLITVSEYIENPTPASVTVEAISFFPAAYVSIHIAPKDDRLGFDDYVVTITPVEDHRYPWTYTFAWWIDISDYGWNLEASWDIDSYEEPGWDLDSELGSALLDGDAERILGLFLQLRGGPMRLLAWDSR